MARRTSCVRAGEVAPEVAVVDPRAVWLVVDPSVSACGWAPLGVARRLTVPTIPGADPDGTVLLATAPVRTESGETIAVGGVRPSTIPPPPQTRRLSG